jgi:hypothetical protein
MSITATIMNAATGRPIRKMTFGRMPQTGAGQRWTAVVGRHFQATSGRSRSVADTCGSIDQLDVIARRVN